MDAAAFNTLLLKNFPYEPTNGQLSLLKKLSDFILSRKSRDVFLMKGYGGTGKTTLVSLLVNHLSQIERKSILLAPTGRAAKVISGYSGQRAFTIHKKIYRVAPSHDGILRLGLSNNPLKKTLFIVDEASMIPDHSNEENNFTTQRSLLNDLMEYVFSDPSNQLILIGDSAQLPPVGLEISPALDSQYLRNSFSINLTEFELTDVVRQAQDSGILMNATAIRNNLKMKGIQPLLITDVFTDIHAITGEYLEEALQNCFSSNGFEDSVIITRSNKRAGIYNQEIRRRILFYENEIATGDLMMIVKNNYFWLDSNSKTGFLANGDMIELLRIGKYEELYGFRFAEVTVRLIDYPEEKEIQLKIMLDTLTAEGPAMTQGDIKKLFDEVMKEYEDEPSKTKRLELVKKNPYYNALQIKFGYALTCHKTQGGQWNNVFIDWGYVKSEQVNMGFYRWLYTAFTRATQNLYLVNFPESIFKKN